MDNFCDVFIKKLKNNYGNISQLWYIERIYLKMIVKLIGATQRVSVLCHF